MTEHTAFVLSVALLCTSCLLGGWQMFSLRRGGKRLRKESSRFPMYAVRDQLVLLIASGELSRREKGWRMAYAAVNAALDMHKQHDAFTVFRKFTEFQSELKHNEILRARVMHVKHEEEVAARRSPNFRPALAHADRAFMYMIMRQSYWWQHFAATRLLKRSRARTKKAEFRPATGMVVRSPGHRRQVRAEPEPGTVVAFLTPASC